MRFLLASVWLAVVCMSSQVHAHSYRLEQLEITHPNARASRPGVLSSSAYFGVKNHGDTSDRIVGVSSSIAQHTELHDMHMENDVMRMFRVDGVAVEAGETLVIGEGNHLHIMLMQLKQPLKVGDKFPLSISFEHAGTVEVEVWVEEAGDGAAHHHDHGHSTHGHQH